MTLGGLDRTLVAFVDGAVDASQLIVVGGFNDEAVLTVSMVWTSEQGASFTVQRDVRLRIRACLHYEYVQDGVCRRCNVGYLIMDSVSGVWVELYLSRRRNFSCGVRSLRRRFSIWRDGGQPEPLKSQPCLDPRPKAAFYHKQTVAEEDVVRGSHISVVRTHALSHTRSDSVSSCACVRLSYDPVFSLS